MKGASNHSVWFGISNPFTCVDWAYMILFFAWKLALSFLCRKIIKKIRDNSLKSIKKLIDSINKLKIAINKFGSLR